MNTSKKTNKSNPAAKKASLKVSDLGAKSDPRGGRKSANVGPRQVARVLARENNPRLIQY